MGATTRPSPYPCFYHVPARSNHPCAKLTEVSRRARGREGGGGGRGHEYHTELCRLFEPHTWSHMRRKRSVARAIEPVAASHARSVPSRRPGRCLEHPAKLRRGVVAKAGSMALLPVNEAMRRLTAGRRLEYLFSRPADHDHRGIQEFWLSGKIEGPCRKAKKSQGDVTGGRLCIVKATSAVHCAPKLLRVRGGRYGGTCILLMTPSWWSIVLKQTMAWRGA
jgi:hypothetical protein